MMTPMQTCCTDGSVMIPDASVGFNIAPISKAAGDQKTTNCGLAGKGQSLLKRFGRH